MNLEKIYQQTILEYSNRRELKKEIEEPTYIERGHNPNCGDDLTLEVKLNGDVIEDAAFLGSGCAISSASTAMLIDLIKGKTMAEAEEKANMPARVKCATLSWHSLRVITEKYEK